MNIITLSGNLGADPEVFYSSEGNPVASFNLAFRSGKDKTGWIKIVAYKKLAEIVEQHLTKGIHVVVSGSFDQQKWTANDGSARTAYQINAQNIDFFHAKSSQESEFTEE